MFRVPPSFGVADGVPATLAALVAVGDGLVCAPTHEASIGATAVAAAPLRSERRVIFGAFVVLISSTPTSRMSCRDFIPRAHDAQRGFHGARGRIELARPLAAGRASSGTSPPTGALDPS